MENKTRGRILNHQLNNKKMNNELINFHHEMFGDIRAIEKDGGPWFVGKDVAVALEYCKPENCLAAHVD